MLSSTPVTPTRSRAAHPGERLLELRRERKWSQEQVAAKAGLTVRTVRNLERGATEPDRIHPETYDKLARLFEVPVEELDPRRRRKWLEDVDLTPDQLDIVENILALPPDRLAAVRQALKRLRGRK
jgi:transcriptional regulator with XRE-family HTH domain